MNLTIVSRLIEMGAASNLDDPEILEDFADLKDKGEEVLYGLSRETIAGLTTEEITALVKAMTIAEDRWGWIGGSVSPVIRVFKELESRDFDLSHQVAEWIVRRSKFNTYVPFGDSRRRVELLARIALREREAAIQEFKDLNISLEQQILQRSDHLAWERTKNEWLNAHLEANNQEGIRQRRAQEQRERKEQAERDYKELNRIISQQRGGLHSLARERNTLNKQEFLKQGEQLDTYERLKMVAEKCSPCSPAIEICGILCLLAWFANFVSSIDQ